MLVFIVIPSVAAWVPVRVPLIEADPLIMESSSDTVTDWLRLRCNKTNVIIPTIFANNQGSNYTLAAHSVPSLYTCFTLGLYALTFLWCFFYTSDLSVWIAVCIVCSWFINNDLISAIC